MDERKKLIILGIGNILLQDEGFGVHFVNWFEHRWRLPEDAEIIDGGTLGYVLLSIMSRCERMIVIDVMRLADEPGAIYRFSREEMETHLPPPTTAHEVTFADVLFKADLMGECPDMVFLCIVPQLYQDMGLEMTPRIGEKFPAMEKLLLAELAKNEIYPERLPIMHELSLINGLLEIVSTYEQAEGFERVNALKLSFGCLSGIDRSALQFAFDVQSRGTKSEGAALQFDILPAIIYCLVCEREMVIEKSPLACPQCRGESVMLTGGTESLRLIEMDVD